ncbi:hypothetical protein QUW15_12100 [Desulfovibrio piger]|nr:hypothetical protein [Desulfovibrio piger]
MPTAGDYHNILREQDQNGNRGTVRHIGVFPRLLHASGGDNGRDDGVLTAPHIPG